MAQAKKTTKTTTAAKTTKATEEKTTAAKTTAAKATAAKTAEVKTAAVKPETTVEVKAEVKPAATKAPAKRTTAKKAATEVKTELYVEFGGQQVFADKVIEDVKKTYAAQGGTDEIKSVKVYLKPEEQAAYFVVNDTINGRMDVFFS